VSRDIQRLARANRIPFVVLSVDEAHLVAPNDDKVVTTQVLREIARIGRHYRIGLVLTTQSPADMDRSILKRLLTRFIFAIEPDQLDALRGVFADAPEAILGHLTKFPVGTCVLTGVSETVKHATVVDIRSRRTPIGGRTPDIFADLAKRGWKKRKEFEEIISDGAGRGSRK
jgi:DNA helicase HerA-like ATPase